MSEEAVVIQTYSLPSELYALARTKFRGIRASAALDKMVPILQNLYLKSLYAELNLGNSLACHNALRHPPNVNEAVLRFVMENDGRLPTGPAEMNSRCVLTVHPRVGLTLCPYSHIIGGQITSAKIEHQLCPSRMIIYVPVNDSPATRHKAIMVLENPHNHPMHPTSKPSTEDKLKLKTAVNAAGLNGLTVQKLLNAPSTLKVYNGKRVADSSPAFVDTRKVRDFIMVQKKLEHPRALGWEGVLYHLNTREANLPKPERYIHTAMSKNGFRLVVTMHPQLAILIHKILSLNIDFTFKAHE
ncbi:hypothetical protein K438DRAFT_1759501 [Mycena galopus ATCC 62051]|nr:hypothetical protein K438DRAFT_1759501 [Mycena galopus ATCC 62051]